MSHYLVTLSIINTITTMAAIILLATVNLLLAFGVRFLLKGHLRAPWRTARPGSSSTSPA